ncbi:hypothetical protein EYZ11_006408 [Aspergillus tanneri]|uniref:S-adenosyl-L-methionine-dependent methyltransferase n=1 Tax=Aspergillus tanneri TaxID=1220188 RepID=A0A4S3JFK1_9EURO|nr:uncharacterized protein ATNIH1004_008131 [Aspergillus tanneri]KAA8643935.1 hypothetical protein ATNIH1004_008131 [Aspergillus tanneri]THC94119.1 hypothetical protein EYZ11_006408 [Aspergillus tanneri]
MSEPNNTRFNDEAATWDSNPTIQVATRLAFQTLQPIIQSLSDQNRTPGSAAPCLDVLEVGCGTGLLTVRVAPLVHEIVAVDTAQGMIDMLQTKITTSPVTQNIIPVCKLLQDPEDPVLPPMDQSNPAGPRRKFDLVLSHLVMHHIPDLRLFLHTLLDCLKPGAHVVLTDFEDFGPEAIKFHPPSKLDGVERHGIPRAWMEGLMREVGFQDVKVWVGWRLDMEVEGWEDAGKVMQFPFLVCEGVRPLSA